MTAPNAKPVLRRAVVLLAIVFGPVVGLYALTYRSHVAIDRQRWADGDVRYRQQLARELAATGQLVGLDGTAAHRELGPPDHEFSAAELAGPLPDTSHVWWYGLQFPGPGVTDTLNLVVRFNRAGRVSEVFVRHKW